MEKLAIDERINIRSKRKEVVLDVLDSNLPGCDALEVSIEFVILLIWMLSTG